MRRWPDPFAGLHRLRSLFAYYVVHHLQIVLAPQKLMTGGGATLGYIEDIRVARGRVQVRGWCLANRVSLRIGDHVHMLRPTIERNDVADALHCEPNVGFESSLPAGPGMLVITAGHEAAQGGDVVRVETRLPGPRRLAWARLRLWGPFLATLLRLAPMIVTGARRDDPLLRQRVKTALGLDRLGGAGGGEIMPQALRRPGKGREPDPPAAAGSATLVMPVHNAYDVLPEALERIRKHTGGHWRMILVEDASTDDRVRPFLRDWARAARAGGAEVTLIEAPDNRGFVASANTGLEAAAAHPDPVVLLNSDALVPAGWLERLLAPMRADPRVASVTPMSNDAEIFSAPAICDPLPLAPGQADAIDAVAARLIAPGAGAGIDAPTGVGFCMALSPEFLSRVPQFDTAFGRGYGEEVDWCRRTAAMGGRHVAAANLFVEHRGGQSFGSEEKRGRQRENGALISRRYPGYDARVQEFIQGDPLLTPRLVLALASLDTLPGGPGIPVYIAHSMGGGAESWLQERIAAGFPRAAVVLRMGGIRRCRIEVETAAGCTMGSTDDLDLVARLIALLSRRRIVYSCAVGDPDPVAIPDFLLTLAAGLPLEILFHDFLAVSPSYTLLDSDGVYRDPPVAPNDNPAHASRRPDGSTVDLARWQQAWGRAMIAADRVILFSESSREILETVYPAAREAFVVTPHELTHTLPPLVRHRADPGGRERVIGVLGNIGPQKGAGVVQALSRRLNGTGRARGKLVLLGRIDPAFQLAASARIHGPYEHGDLPALVVRYGITCWLIPSIWPETFSYTTHECLATGLPVLAFNIGAQGEAVARAPNGHPVPLSRKPVPPERLCTRILNVLETLSPASDPPGASVRKQRPRLLKGRIS
ncbi:glycosyltransferase family 2 protein [Roseisalinus antarcticus]|uniref:N-glycosyltransferase n=1 Tax=Roseisalinus antarcticus TaxID=254357 RepID=A0A1Y5TVG3_9RHOB|nr:glycosyltransferase [Roseisalinus antarcticus]SLN69100.1 N-glycosyltransferase [Roseisalinus antarcticus]